MYLTQHPHEWLKLIYHPKKYKKLQSILNDPIDLNVSLSADVLNTADEMSSNKASQKIK